MLPCFFIIFSSALADVALTELLFLYFLPAVAVIKASELWAAMEPELLVTVRTVLEPTNEAEEEQEEDSNVEAAEDDMATAVKIAQYLRVNKYR